MTSAFGKPDREDTPPLRAAQMGSRSDATRRSFPPVNLPSFVQLEPRTRKHERAQAPVWRTRPGPRRQH